MNSMRDELREDGLAAPTAIVLVVDDEKRSLESLPIQWQVQKALCYFGN
jgi:hypothetical protein